jgi:hypothetical protein
MRERMGAETTMTVGWIGEHLAMGKRGYLNHLLYRRRKFGGEVGKIIVFVQRVTNIKN